jgi:preprotein translocase subunit SecE
MNIKENAVVRYIKDSLAELTKVTWPTKNQAIKLTGIVLVFVLLTAVFLAVVDFGFNWIYTYILTSAK